MCTLIALWHCHPSAPLVLALNRDEFLSRPTAPFELWEAETDEATGGGTRRAIASGRDLREGGTWFGVSRGVVAGLTNHRAGSRSMPGERSRGDLVVRALTRPDSMAARDAMLGLPGGAFGPFHLLVADPHAMHWVTNQSGEMESREVGPGAHVLGNHGLDNPDDPVVVNVLRELDGIDDMDESALRERLRGLLAREGHGWPRVRLGPYGTRSSAMLWWGGAQPALWTLDDASSPEAWEDKTALLPPGSAPP